MELICIQCPLGCHISIEKKGDGFHVEGNTCVRGKDYAIQEMTHPLRTITTTVLIHDALHDRLPVITSHPIEKKDIFPVLKALQTVEVHAPVHRFDVIVKNVAGTKVDMLASRSMEKVK